VVIRAIGGTEKRDPRRHHAFLPGGPWLKLSGAGFAAIF
jgi:hypothetical protein